MLFLIVTFILCLPLVLFALSNTEIVRLGLWPMDYGIDVHLSLAILIAMAIAFLLGALVVWISELGATPPSPPRGTNRTPAGEPRFEATARLAPPRRCHFPPPDAIKRPPDRRAGYGRCRQSPSRLGRRPFQPHAGLLKLGLEFFLANGAAGYKHDRPARRSSST